MGKLTQSQAEELGVSKHKYSKKMTELKEAVEKVVNEFTTNKK